MEMTLLFFKLNNKTAEYKKVLHYTEQSEKTFYKLLAFILPLTCSVKKNKLNLQCSRKYSASKLIQCVTIFRSFKIIQTSSCYKKIGANNSANKRFLARSSS